MNCETVKPLLSEFLDERLDAATTWQVQRHVSDCAACGQIRRDFDALTGALRSLPGRTPSAAFEASLAQRIALTRRPASKRTWLQRLLPSATRPASALKPAFALGAAAVAVGGVFLLPVRTQGPDPRAAVPSTDHAFVADCVAQRSREAAGEPLSDPSAQNLAGTLDSAAPPEPSATPGGDSEVF